VIVRALWYTPVRAVEGAFGLIHVGLTESSPQIFQTHTIGSERRRFAWIRTAGRWPPLMLTRPTPVSCEIFCARVVSARSSTLEAAKDLDVSARVRIGASRGIDFAVDRRD